MKAKNTLDLATSIIRGNKGLSIGIGLMFLVMITLMIATVVLPSSVPESTNRFIEDYRMPQAWIATSPTSAEAPDIDGVTDAEAGISLDVPVRSCKNPDDNYTLRVFSIEQDGFRRFHTVSETASDPDLINVWITAYFAEQNGIAAGDQLEIKTPTGYQKALVQKIVSLPESMVCVRNQASWRDTTDFGYLYLQRKDVDTLFGTTGLANFWSLRFQDGMTEAQKEDALSAYAEKLDAAVVSQTLYEQSGIKTALDDLHGSLKNICLLFPGVIFVIGVFFIGLFMRQIVLSQRKTIGLLRAMGYSTARVMSIFILFVLIINLCSFIPGIILGIVTTKWFVETDLSTYAVPEVFYSVPVMPLVAVFLIVISTGIICCLISVKSIADIDPSEAYADSPITGTKPPAFLQHIATGVSVKLVLTSIWRNRARFFQSAFSIAACMVLIITSLLYLQSQSAAAPLTFGNRFRYDCMVGVSEGTAALSAARNQENVAEVEPLTVFFTTMKFNGQSKDVQINAIDNNSALIVPSNSDGQSLSPGDGILLDEWTAATLGIVKGDVVQIGDMSLTVTGIARELVNGIQYISQGTAGKMDHESPNYLLIRFDSAASQKKDINSLMDLPGYEYTTVLEHQHKDFLNMIALIELIAFTVIGIGIFLGMLIVYNMIVMNLHERRFEYATLIALGTPTRRFAGMAGLENLILYITAFIPACPIAWLLSKFVLTAMSTDFQYLPIMHLWSTFALAGAASLLFLAAGMFFTMRSVHKIDPGIALNARE